MEEQKHTCADVKCTAKLLLTKNDSSPLLARIELCGSDLYRGSGRGEGYSGWKIFVKKV